MNDFHAQEECAVARLAINLDFQSVVVQHGALFFCLFLRLALHKLSFKQIGRGKMKKNVVQHVMSYCSYGVNKLPSRGK